MQFLTFPVQSAPLNLGTAALYGDPTGGTGPLPRCPQTDQRPVVTDLVDWTAVNLSVHAVIAERRISRSLDDHSQPCRWRRPGRQ